MSSDSKPLSKKRWFIATAVVIAVPAMALSWYLFSPLFLNRTVVEEFPQAAAADVAAPSNVVREDATSVAEVPAETTVGPAVAAPEPVALVSGEVVGADAFHQGSGTATIYELVDGSRALRLENLDVTNGPDLHVLLSPVADPSSRDDVVTSGYVDLGELKGNRGDQNYEIPQDFEIGDELSVVIYCVPFHVIFSTATLVSS